MTTSSAALDVRQTFGAVYIGVVFAAFFQGILTVQAYIYYETFPQDTWVFKSLVAVVWTLDLVHLVVIGTVPWDTLVVNWGNAADFTTKWKALSIVIIFVGAPTVLCQGFFLHRLWRFSKRNWILTGPMALGAISVFILDFYFTVQSLVNPALNAYQQDAPKIVAMLGIGAATDISIALSLVWYLQRGVTGFEKTNFVVTRIIQFTVATGLASSLLAIGCAVANSMNPQNFIFIALHSSLGRMYTNALLATLNSRRNLRVALGTTENLGTANFSMSPPVFVVSNQRTDDSLSTDVRGENKSQ
ncbi:hypothetical protein B0H12DRAFT_1165662 [Mycena haematopus]|nr:hypothetical protein B0H12DRAFT_1165662 [Mycena haematopus]